MHSRMFTYLCMNRQICVAKRPYSPQPKSNRCSCFMCSLKSELGISHSSQSACEAGLHIQMKGAPLMLRGDGGSEVEQRV